MRLESEMIAPIKQRLAEHWKDGLMFEEFGVGYGVADVVAVRPSQPGIDRRRRLGQVTALPRRAEVQVLRVLRQHGTATFQDLLEITGISSKRLRYETLRFLLRENYIEERRPGLYRRRGRHQPIAREIWAVEAKMKNWFEGLCQARRYQHFAHRVYLAIADRHRSRVRDAVLRKFNIGLITVAPAGATIVFHPQRRIPHNEELFLVSNERIWEQIQPA